MYFSGPKMYFSGPKVYVSGTKMYFSGPRSCFAGEENTMILGCCEVIRCLCESACSVNLSTHQRNASRNMGRAR